MLFRSGSVVVDSTSTATIKALALAGSGAGAFAGSSSLSLSFTGAGAGTGNDLVSEVSAVVTNGSEVEATAGRLSVTATDASSILANAIAGSFALSTGSGTSVAVALGATVANNTITNTVQATVAGASKLTAGSDILVKSQDRKSTRLNSSHSSVSRMPSSA